MKMKHFPLNFNDFSGAAIRGGQADGKIQIGQQILRMIWDCFSSQSQQKTTKMGQFVQWRADIPSHLLGP